MRMISNEELSMIAGGAGNSDDSEQAKRASDGGSCDAMGNCVGGASIESSSGYVAPGSNTGQQTATVATITSVAILSVAIAASPPVGIATAVIAATGASTNSGIQLSAGSKVP